jgi:aminoglycoside/choline kinase family phosphotransferase
MLGFPYFPGIPMTTATPEQIPDFAAIRQELMTQFVMNNGWASATKKLLVDQASFRRYYRLIKADGKTIVLLDSPNPNAPQERLPNVVAYSKILNDIGLRAPHVTEADFENGFALIEDFGDDVFSSVFDRGGNMEEYLTPAMDALIHLHRNLDPAVMPQLGNALDYYTSEHPHFTNWFWPAQHNHETPPDVTAEYLATWKKLLVELPQLPLTMSMTDYHAPNLMALKDGKGIQSVGIIDFQDSILSSPVYDVMSLLEDDRRDLDDAIGLKLRAYYREAMKDKIDPELFDLHYAVYSAQRHAKNMGNFVRIAVQKNNPVWLTYMPTVTKWFDRALHSHPYLAPMQKWFAKNCPDYNQPLENIRFFLK